jgi:hypothetical protein
VVSVAALLIVASLLFGTGDAGQTRLTIEIRGVPGAEPDRYTLACEPPAGTVRDPGAACRRVTALARAAAAEPMPPSSSFREPRHPSEVYCPPVYGGPEVMVVRGLFAGHPVDGRYTREDGCAMLAYDRMARILGVPASRAGDEDVATL